MNYVLPGMEDVREVRGSNGYVVASTFSGCGGWHAIDCKIKIIQSQLAIRLKVCNTLNMKTPTESILNDIESLNERIDRLFDKTERGTDFGRGFRQILVHAEDHALNFGWQTAQSMMSVVDELLTTMEKNAETEDSDA